MHIRSDSPTTQHADKVMRLLQRFNAQVDPTKGADSSSPFSKMLVGSIQRVNAMQNSANSQMEQFVTVGGVDQAEVFTSVQKADMSFRMLVQIRNKLMQAYEEINSIRV
jgi:flagellar hook-basal body complex protein FliE